MKAKVDAGDETEKTIDRLGIVVEELTNMGADSMEAKAHGILSGLGFTMEMQTKPTTMFSGGWLMIIDAVVWVGRLKFCGSDSNDHFRERPIGNSKESLEG